MAAANRGRDCSVEAGTLFSSSHLFVYVLLCAVADVSSLVVEKPCCSTYKHTFAFKTGYNPYAKSSYPNRTVTGKLVRLDDPFACSRNPGNRSDILGSVILAQYGFCGWTRQVDVAQQSNASGLVIFNRPEDRGIMDLSTDSTKQLTMPMVMTHRPSVCYSCYETAPLVDVKIPVIFIREISGNTLRQRVDLGKFTVISINSTGECDAPCNNGQNGNVGNGVDLMVALVLGCAFLVVLIFAVIRKYRQNEFQKRTFQQGHPDIEIAEIGIVVTNGNAEKSSWYYYISHMQAEGATIAEKFFASMEKRGKKCWLDVQMDERDAEAMENGIKNSDVVLVIVSPNYFTRPFCIKELEWSVKYMKPMIVVIDVKHKNDIGNILETCPTHLKNIGKMNFIELNRGDKDYWKVGMNKIQKAEKIILEINQGTARETLEISMRV